MSVKVLVVFCPILAFSIKVSLATFHILWNSTVLSGSFSFVKHTLGYLRVTSPLLPRDYLVRMLSYHWASYLLLWVRPNRDTSTASTCFLFHSLFWWLGKNVLATSICYLWTISDVVWNLATLAPYVRVDVFYALSLHLDYRLFEFSSSFVIHLHYSYTLHTSSLLLFPHSTSIQVSSSDVVLLCEILCDRLFLWL